MCEQTLDEFGKIDILVNNAGTNPYFGPLMDMEERTWDQIMTVNLKGYYLLATAVAKGMIERKSGQHYQRIVGGRQAGVAGTGRVLDQQGRR